MQARVVDGEAHHNNVPGADDERCTVEEGALAYSAVRCGEASCSAPPAAPGSGGGRRGAGLSGRARVLDLTLRLEAMPRSDFALLFRLPCCGCVAGTRKCHAADEPRAAGKPTACSCQPQRRPACRHRHLGTSGSSGGGRCGGGGGGGEVSSKAGGSPGAGRHCTHSARRARCGTAGPASACVLAPTHVQQGAILQGPRAAVASCCWPQPHQARPTCRTAVR